MIASMTADINDPEVNTEIKRKLTFSHKEQFDITNGSTGQEVSINLSSGVEGGTGPYTYSAVGLPDWLTLTAGTGMLTGTIPADGADETSAVITVTDAKGNRASITITIGEIS